MVAKTNLPDKDLPNIVTVLLDDTGFAHLGCFGSIDTPNFDALAARAAVQQLSHNRLLLSFTNALTGRNLHSVGMRAVSNFDTGFPNMRAGLALPAATTAELLQHHGWATYCVGKWHLAPMRAASAAGPLPTGLSSADLIASTALCRAKQISFTLSSMLTTI